MLTGNIFLNVRFAAFQFRYGGYKGILVAYPDKLFDTLYDGEPGKYVIAVRPSMLKYEGGPSVIEVNNVSMPPFPARLNHAFVVLLLTLGVKLEVRPDDIISLFRTYLVFDKAFEELLNIQVQEIEAISCDRERAKSCLKGDLDAEGSKFYQDGEYYVFTSPAFTIESLIDNSCSV